MPLTILITGFGPFPGAPKNPSGPLAQRLARRRRPAFADVRRMAHVFETTYRAIDQEWPTLLSRHGPDAVLMFGLASRTRHLRIETRARNSISSLFPDAERRKPANEKLANGGPAWRPVRVPAGIIVHAARATGAPAVLSRDAGRYLCNALLWRALEAGDKTGGPRLAAFVHVPRTRQVAFEKMARAGEAILFAILAAARRPR